LSLRLVPGDGGGPADAVDLELLGVALLDAGHHVVDEGAGGAPEGADLLVAGEGLVDVDR
jgi:hypothetical protein